jgi:hypothetical protein
MRPCFIQQIIKDDLLRELSTVLTVVVELNTCRSQVTKVDKEAPLHAVAESKHEVAEVGSAGVERGLHGLTAVAELKLGDAISLKPIVVLCARPNGRGRIEARPSRGTWMIGRLHDNGRGRIEARKACRRSWCHWESLRANGRGRIEAHGKAGRRNSVDAGVHDLKAVAELKLELGGVALCIHAVSTA